MGGLDDAKAKSTNSSSFRSLTDKVNGDAVVKLVVLITISLGFALSAETSILLVKRLRRGLESCKLPLLEKALSRARGFWL